MESIAFAGLMVVFGYLLICGGIALAGMAYYEYKQRRK